MRIIPASEKRQRGCQYCYYVGTAREKMANRFGCPFDECPYHVLDKYKSYEEYMKSTDSKILVNDFFSGGTAFCEVARSRKTPRTSSDGGRRTQL